MSGLLADGTPENATLANATLGNVSLAVTHFLPCAEAELGAWSSVTAAAGLGFLFIFFLSMLWIQQPKVLLLMLLSALLLFVFGLLIASPLGFSWLSVPDQCEYDSFVFSLFISLFFIVVPLFFIFVLLRRYAVLSCIADIEGDLPARLADDSIRLLRVGWLLERPADYILQRRQDLPPDAFWSPDDAVRLLREGKVSALSYRWIDAQHSDPHRFHLDIVLAYFREGNHAAKHTALLLDFASLPQKDPVTGAERDDEDAKRFAAGLKVMNSAYASPRVLVLQQKRLPPEREGELRQDFGGCAPADRPDRIPYAGKESRSGWCTFETACALLMTEGGGHAYELGVGSVPVTRGRLPDLWQMESIFAHESTRFIGRADREMVCGQYVALRFKMMEHDTVRNVMVMISDALMTREGEIWAYSRILITLMFLLCNAIAIEDFAASVNDKASSLYLTHGLVANLAIYIFLALIVLGVFVLPSRIVRAHLYAFFCRLPRDSLEYTFHCSLRRPPFRPRRPRRPERAIPVIKCSGCNRKLKVDESVHFISEGLDFCVGCFAQHSAEEQEGFTKQWVRARWAHYEPEDWPLPDGTAPLAELPWCFLPTEQRAAVAAHVPTALPRAELGVVRV